MTKTPSRLRLLRKRVGLSLRELARQIGVDHSNVRYWELSDKIPRSDLLVPIANALGVSVEEILGITKEKKIPPPAGKLRLVFEAVSKLPRNQQEKILEVINALLEQHQNSQS